MISNRDKVTYNEVAEYYHSNKVLFGTKYFKNWFLEQLASSCPVPAWRAKLHKMRGVNIGNNVYIGYNVVFDRLHPELITIDDYAEIGDRSILSAHSRGSLTTRDAYPRTTAPIKIGRGVCINPGCIITQGVTIGENSIIGIGSVVSRDISPNCVALGFPARVVKKLKSEKNTSGKISSFEDADVKKEEKGDAGSTSHPIFSPKSPSIASMGINVHDVRAGDGGHGLTRDTDHLENSAKIGLGDLDYPIKHDSTYILVRKANDFIPNHMFKLTQDALADVGKEIKGSKVALLGWAFINDSDDARKSPSEPYRDLLLEAGAEVVVHDPHVLGYPGVEIEKDISSVLEDADVISVMTGHADYFKLKPLDLKEATKKELPVIVDGRNVMEPEEFIEEGFVYRGIGRGDKN